MRIYVAGPMTGYPDLNFPAFHAAAAALRDVFGELFGGGLDFLLGLATPVPPRAAVGLVERELAGLGGVGPDQSEIGRRNEDGIVAGEFEADHLAAGAVAHVERLQAIEQSEAALQMHDG